MEIMKGIRVICFDIGGTLLDCGPSFVGDLQSLVGRSVLRSEWDSLYNLSQGSVQKDLTRISREFNLKFDEVFCLYKKHRQQIPHLFDDVLSTIQELSHLQCVTLSNASRWMAYDTLYGIEVFFSDMFYSYTIGHAKPHLEAFQFVQRAVETEAENILMVGDSLAYDYEGAIAAGWRAVLIDRCERNLRTPNSITRLDMLIDLLG